MKLDQYKFTISRLRGHLQRQNLIKDVEFFRYWNGTWFQEDDEPVVDSKVILDLTEAFSSAEDLTFSKHGRAYYLMSEFSALVSFHSSKIKAESKRSKVLQGINDGIETISYEYGAKHNKLTGLINKDFLEQYIIDEIDKIKQPSSENSDNESDPSPGQNNQLVLLALDIDKFKQINDDFGHAYGDIVLQGFSNRLEVATAALRKRFGSRVRFQCAHPSGEEFNIVLSGVLTESDEDEIAREFLQTIGGDPLPNSTEWAVFSPAKWGKKAPPIGSPRRVTASIGLKRYQPGEAEGDVRDEALFLLDRADLALYRAKAAGRNQCVKFSRIVQRYGRVIEHDSARNIVVIDIGKNVGVTPGQEFKIFDPKYSGETPIIYSDGRSQRLLGTYPRIARGTLEVFDIQTEISFCRVRTKDGEESIGIGSHLDAVPAGEIAHLLKDSPLPGHQNPTLLSPSEFTDEFIARSLGTTVPHVAVVAIKSFQDLLRDRGITFVNSVIASLYEKLRDELDIRSRISQIQSGKFLLFIPAQESDLDKKLTAVADYVREAYFGIPSIIAGYVTAQRLEAEPYKPAYAYQYANLACAYLDDSSRSESIAEFNATIASASVRALRSRGEHETLIKRIEELRTIGITSDILENYLGLTLRLLGRNEEAVAAYKRALEMVPEDAVVHANLGFALFQLGRRLEAYSEYSMAKSLLKKRLPDAYAYSMAISAAEQYKTDPASIDLDSVINEFVEAKRVASAAKHNDRLEELERVEKELRTQA